LDGEAEVTSATTRTAAQANPTADPRTSQQAAPDRQVTTATPRRLEATHHQVLADTPARSHRILKAVHRGALTAFEGGGRTDAADRHAACVYVANALAALAAEGILDEHDTQVALEALADARDDPIDAVRYEVHAAACASPLLVELPPLVACEIQLRLLVLLGVVVEVSLWYSIEGAVEPIVSVGDGAESRRARATAKSALRGGGMLSMLGSRTFRSALIRRFRTPCAAIVARVSGPVARADSYLAATAAAMSVIYERELLLGRSAERERLLVRAGEQRLMRIGFDLHDGPIQDVLSLGAEVTLLRDQV